MNKQIDQDVKEQVKRVAQIVADDGLRAAAVVKRALNQYHNRWRIELYRRMRDCGEPLMRRGD